jgi:hypothetical protein
MDPEACKCVCCNKTFKTAVGLIYQCGYSFCPACYELIGGSEAVVDFAAEIAAKLEGFKAMLVRARLEALLVTKALRAFEPKNIDQKAYALLWCRCPNPALHQELAGDQPIDPEKCARP